MENKRNLFIVVEVLSKDNTIYHLDTPYEVGVRIEQVANDLGYELSREDLAFVSYWLGINHASQHTIHKH